jgi:hypothetical protein
VKLLELRQRRERALEQEQFRLDRVVCELLDTRDSVRAEVDHLRARRQHLERRLHDREAELQHMCETPESLSQLLAAVPEDRLERALVLLGHVFVDDSPEEVTFGSEAAA